MEDISLLTDLEVSDNQLAEPVRCDMKVTVLRTGLLGLISSEDTVAVLMMEHAGLPSYDGHGYNFQTP